MNTWIKALAAITLLSILAWMTTNRGEDKIRNEAERNLSSLIEVIRAGLAGERRQLQSDVQAFALHPEAAAATGLLLSARSSVSSLIASEGQQRIRRLLQPLLERAIYQGFFIIGPDNVNLASSRDQNVGAQNLLVDQTWLLERAWSGETLTSHPLLSDIPIPDAHGEVQESKPTLFAVAPIENAAGERIALLALRVDPDLTIFPIVASAYGGESGKSFLFDRDGLLRSKIRFAQSFRDKGMLAEGSSAFQNLVLKRPGSNELTRPVVSASSGADGVDSGGYIDHRGVEVVGAWYWLDDYALGVATEVDKREIYAGLVLLRNTVLGTTLTATLLIQAIAFLSTRQQRVLRREVVEQTAAAEYQSLRLDTFFRHAPNGLVLLDENYRITLVNTRAREIFGRAEEYLVGETMDALFADPLPSLESMVEGHDYEINGLRADGREVPLRLSITETHGPDCTIFLVRMRDLTEAKRLDRAVSEEKRRRRHVEQRERRLLDALGEGILGTDESGVITFVNPAAARILDYAPEDLIGKHLGDDKGSLPLCDADSPLLDPMHFTTNPHETLLRRSDGTWFDAEYVRTSLREDDQTSGAVILFGDISERKSAEQSLRLAESVFSHITDGVVVANAQGRILRVNRALCDMVGYAADEIIGQVRPPYRSNEHAPVFYEKLWDTLSREGRWEGEIWNRRKNGEVFPTLQTIVAIFDSDGELSRYISVTRDTTEQKRTEQRIQRLAYYDNLTGLANRELFHDRFEHAMQRAQRQVTGIALLFLDLDRFKNVNDSLGHPIGDLLLKAVAERLKNLVREEDTIARLGGDEFTILLESINEESAIRAVAEKVIDALSRPFNIDEHSLHIGTSVGISRYPHDGSDITTLIKYADSAMYKAKAAGRNNYQFYSHELSTQSSDRMLMEANLHRAIANDEFILHYQPQYAGDGSLVGIEALVRWQDPILGLISPDHFIPLSEETGLIVTIGEWVLRSACAQMKAWLDDGAPDIKISVNLSGRQIMRSDISSTVAEVLADTGLPAYNLELEVTETFVMDNVDRAIEVLTKLRLLGVSIAIDDFGTGHSSLASLKRLPVDTLKIDRAFVPDTAEDASGMAIARAIMTMAHQLNISTIAEGVETAAQRDFLRDEGCEGFQGFLFARPLEASNVETLWQPETEIKVANGGEMT